MADDEHDETDHRHLLELHTIRRRTIRGLERQEATFGASSVPPHIANQLHDERQALARIEDQMRRQGIPISPLPILWRRPRLILAFALVALAILAVVLWPYDRHAEQVAQDSPTATLAQPLPAPPAVTPTLTRLPVANQPTMCIDLTSIAFHAPDIGLATDNLAEAKRLLKTDDDHLITSLPSIIQHLTETIAYAPNNDGNLRFEGAYQMSVALAYYERYQSEGHPLYQGDDLFPCAIQYLTEANRLAPQAMRDRLLTKNHGQLVVYSQTDPCQGLALLEDVERTQVPYDAIDFYRGLAFAQLNNWDEATTAFDLIEGSTSSDDEVKDIQDNQLPTARPQLGERPQNPQPTPCR